jgi:predicted helicase
MIGLYLLTTTLLERLRVIKFGMSMRIEFRWIDYLSVFQNSKYAYYYEFVDDLSRNDILEIENEIIQIYQDKRNEYFQTEYFNCENKKEFHKTIVEILNKRNIKYTYHTEHNFKRENYDNKPDEPYQTKNQNINSNTTLNKPLSNTTEPEDHQKEVLDKIEDAYNHNNILKLIWSCGLGKSLLSIFIVKKLNYKLVVIGVPSINLQKQMKEEIYKIFPKYENILYIGGMNDDNIKSSTDIKEIKKFIKNSTNECKFLITTYSSCYLLTDINNIDFKIGDESHHLVSLEANISEKAYHTFHKIKSKKTLFMTATEKIIENKQKLYSMDDETVFGKYIDHKSVSWAIEKRKITDYNLLILKNTEKEINDIIKSVITNTENNNSIENKELFLSAYMALKSIEQYNDLKHILIYTNTTQASDLIKKYIDFILEANIINIDTINYYNKSLHSGNINDIKEEIINFKKASWGIISSVYIFGEGFDCPKLYGVVFAENMESEIRIVQCALRPNRLDRGDPENKLDKGNPNKKAYIIIPYIDTNNFMIDNNSYEKCRKIIAKIRNVDENIEYKISVGTIQKNNKKESNKSNTAENNDNLYYIDNADELNKIILRLRYSKALGSKFSEEQDEFNYVRELNKELNIISKEHYVLENTKLKHTNYIEKPDEYFKSKGVWSDWYDFIGIDTNKFIQTKNEWIKLCKENNVSSLDDYKILCDMYEKLPRVPCDFYKDFSSISKELNINKTRR